ncbi:homeobox-leucine zipper protein HDG12 [Oryza sativa Japonica Group]|uniref:homeobox-leucine zipper protein HDG12 n=1 Tax=Oryza sativa subsp. japonica TaxID=39947 RepID=UPI0001C7D560
MWVPHVILSLSLLPPLSHPFSISPSFSSCVGSGVRIGGGDGGRGPERQAGWRVGGRWSCGPGGSGGGLSRWTTIVVAPSIVLRSHAQEVNFVRYCRQIEQGLWAITDIFVNLQRDAYFGVPPLRSRRLPSGCLIANMANSYSEVTRVEHMEVEEKNPINVLYRDLVLSGDVFGAHCWLAALQRACDRYASLVALGVPHHITGGMHTLCHAPSPDPELRIGHDGRLEDGPQGGAAPAPVARGPPPGTRSPPPPLEPPRRRLMSRGRER